ncbi:hypothetical protein HYW41_02735 [Candidatus Daviesbacteria bacterium]|nr:hypothetical protein [Candidatus Daviesbacteria bacterium]
MVQFCQFMVETEEELGPGFEPISPEIKEALGHTDSRFPALWKRIDQQMRKTFSIGTDKNKLSQLAAEWQRLDEENDAIYPSEEELSQPSSPEDEAARVEESRAIYLSAVVLPRPSSPEDKAARAADNLRGRYPRPARLQRWEAKPLIPLSDP